jgi:hypothetical protein
MILPIRRRKGKHILGVKKFLGTENIKTLQH